jgi:hypothetical protein
VQEGAEENLKFIEYVNWLESKNYFPPKGKTWIDIIRSKGNEATHEILPMSQEDAKQVLTFTEMLLKFVYEFPGSTQTT